jgi:hypothetical protein
MARETKTFSFDTDKDADLATWLSALDEGKASGAIRAMLRAGLALSSAATLAGVYRVVQDNRRLLENLSRKVEAGAVVAKGDASDQGDGLTAEQEAALANLEGLGL